MKLLLITGAGASSELGVPTMSQMLSEFRELLRPRLEFADSLKRLDAVLPTEKALDMEDAIDAIERMTVTRRTLDQLQIVDQVPDLLRSAGLRSEAEWFVQHSCERVDTQRATLMWKEVLGCSPPGSLSIATTNYDRSIEIAAESLGIAVEDGFESFSGNEWANWLGFSSRTSTVRLLKLHGSTDWYRLRGNDTDVVKLRHPMPLYGEVSLHVPGPTGALASALVLPTREKLTTKHPYPDLNYRLHEAADAADIVVLLGTALRDAELKAAVRVRHVHRPWLYVTRSGRVPAGFESRLLPVRMNASRFLIRFASRLVATTCRSELDEEVKRILGSGSDLKGTASHELDSALAAFDSRRARAERVVALEYLVDAGYVAAMHDLEKILRDEDPAIACCGASLLLNADDPGPTCARLIEDPSIRSEVKAELKLVLSESRKQLSVPADDLQRPQPELQRRAPT